MRPSAPLSRSMPPRGTLQVPRSVPYLRKRLRRSLSVCPQLTLLLQVRISERDYAVLWLSGEGQTPKAEHDRAVVGIKSVTTEEWPAGFNPGGGKDGAPPSGIVTLDNGLAFYNPDAVIRRAVTLRYVSLFFSLSSLCLPSTVCPQLFALNCSPFSTNSPSPSSGEPPLVLFRRYEHEWLPYR